MVELEFPFQGYIERTEHRGITLEQLRRIAGFAGAHCGEWSDTAPAAFSRTAGQVLAMSFMNLYHVNAWIIRPATKEHDCSFVELLTAEPQLPTWFISHWWGEAIRDFLLCVEKHQGVRGLADTAAPYWVCAYANRQHSLASELTLDPKQTSFFKAMRLADGVLLVLDATTEHTGPATPFARIWCDFEESVAMQDTSLKLDIAAVSGGKAELITEGFVPGDGSAGFHGMTNKMLREEGFPLDVIGVGLAVEIQKGEASMDEDRVHILNSLAGRDGAELHLEPLGQHANYERVNRKLRAAFAVAAAPQASAKGVLGKMRILEVIAGDVEREELSLTLPSCQELHNMRALSDCVSKLRALQRLDLCVTFSHGLASISELGGTLAQFHSLRSLELVFLYCSALSDVAGLGGGLVHLEMLTRMDLMFRGCSALQSLEGLGDGLAQCIALEDLCLDFSESLLASLDELGKGLAPLAGLRKLKIDLGRCSELKDVGPLADGLSGLAALEHLDLNVQGCSQLSNVEGLGRGISGLTAIGMLSLNLSACPLLAAGTGTFRWGAMRELSSLMLDFSECPSLTSAHGLGMSLRGLRQPPLVCLFLNLRDCTGLADAGEIATGVEHLAAVPLLSFDFRGCTGLPKRLTEAKLDDVMALAAACVGGAEL